MENLGENGDLTQRPQSALIGQSLCCAYEDEIQALYDYIPEVANHFTVTSKIGEGSFSCVYLARLKHYPEVNEVFALKHIIPTTHPSRIENELRCLLNIGGQDNVIGVKLCLRNRDHVVIVMPIFLHEKFQEYLHQMDLDETRDYMRNLLIALRRVHHFKVIHRDVKPSNFLYNRVHKQYALVDFGLSSGTSLIDRENEKLGKSAKPPASSTSSASAGKATSRAPLSPSKIDGVVTNSANLQRPHKSGERKSKQRAVSSKLPSSSTMQLPSDRSGLCGCFGKPVICSLCVARNNQVAPRAGTAGFRSPEMLMKSPDQTTAVDIWAAGVIFLSILSARYPFFRAQDDLGHLAQIISLIGSQACIAAAMDVGKLLTLSENVPSVDLKSACMKLRLSQMSHKLGPLNLRNKVVQSWVGISDQPFDLLYKMLDPNPGTRITAEEALKHPFLRTCDNQSSG